MTSYTDAQIATIKTNFAYVRLAYHTILQDFRYQEVASRESWVRLRQHMILKSAMVDDKISLTNKWSSIKAEIDIPWDVHYDRTTQTWRSLSNMARWFYKTDLTTWAPEVDPGLPSIVSISNKDMFKAFGLTGGSLPSESHPPPAPVVPTS